MKLFNKSEKEEYTDSSAKTEHTDISGIEEYIDRSAKAEDDKLRRARRTTAVLSLFLAALITGIVGRRLDVNAQNKLQEHLAAEVLRFHILANSDSEEDQDLKLTVKEQVLDYLEQEMPEELDVAGTKAWLRTHTDELKTVCEDTVTAEGFSYPVNVAVTTCYFPEKTYGDVTFPAGNYEALRVEIGDAKGHNWWCVLYPNLCFLDTVHAVVPEEGKKELKEALTAEEYEQITAGTEFHITWRLFSLFGEEAE